MICKPFINNGRDGCSKGKKYELTHPVLCKHSLNTKKYWKMKDGKRCREGYHLLDTVSDIGVVPETNPCCVKKVLKQTAVNGKSGMKNAAVATAPVMVVAIEAIVHFVAIQILQLVVMDIVFHHQILLD